MPGKPHRHRWRYGQPRPRPGWPNGTTRTCTQCLVQQVYRGRRWLPLEVK